MPSYPHVAPHLEVVPCRANCGAYYVTLKDRIHPVLDMSRL